MHRIEGHAALLVFIAGLVAMGGVAVAVGGQPSLRLSGYNDAPVQIDVATVPPGARACQPGGAPWGGTRAVRLSGRTIGTTTTARVEREAVTARSGAGPWTTIGPGDDIVLALPRNWSAASERICVSNRGPATLVLQGVAVGSDAAATVSRDDEVVTGPGRFRVEGLVSERPADGWTVAGRVPERIAAGTGVAAAPWLVGGGLVVALIAIAALLARRGEVSGAG